MSSTGLAKTACTGSTFSREISDRILHCAKAPGHDGEHGFEITDGVWITWTWSANAAHPLPAAG